MAEKKVDALGKSSDEGKTIAIISYITWIGWIIALIMNNDKKNDFARYHIRQSLVIMIGSLVVGVITRITFLGWFVGGILGIALFVLWLLGLISAINGEKKPIPIIGEQAQEWFKGL
jgi:uncharacterized membrane protein